MLDLARPDIILTATGKTERAIRITAKGQLTIPQPVREQAGLMPGTAVEFELERGVVRLMQADNRGSRPTRGERLVARLEVQGRYGMSTDEILALMRGPSADEELRPAR